MSAILELRQLVFEQTNLTGTAYTPGMIEFAAQGIHTRPELYDFLGATRTDQAEQIARAIIPDHVPHAAEHRQARRSLFGYLVDFLHQSTFHAVANSCPTLSLR